MIKEFCAENFDHIPEAIELGISRIELCDRLDLGGTTPSVAVQKETVAYASQRGVEVMCMIRPRGGDFVYTDEEKEQLRLDAKEAVEAGVDGLVFGCLTKDGKLDKPIMEELIGIAQMSHRQTVCHMAFDHIEPSKQRESIEWLIEKGVTRLLTRGAKTGSALENENQLLERIQWANDRIEILPGGGVTHEIIPELQKRLKTNQFHGTQVVPLS